MTPFDRRTFLKAAGAGAALAGASRTVAATHSRQFKRIREEVVEPYLTDPRDAADGFVIGGPYVPSMR